MTSFNATTAFLLHFPPTVHSQAREPEFQCHHGVPASSLPRRHQEPEQQKFQCHHGVPASLIGIDPVYHYERSFNATTAFLLHWPPGRIRGSGGAVSMPPRRSCFMCIHHQGSGARSWFQCHHGVPASSYYTTG